MAKWEQVIETAREALLDQSKTIPFILFEVSEVGGDKSILVSQCWQYSFHRWAGQISVHNVQLSRKKEMMIASFSFQYGWDGSVQYERCLILGMWAGKKKIDTRLRFSFWLSEACWHLLANLGFVHRLYKKDSHTLRDVIHWLPGCTFWHPGC